MIGSIIIVSLLGAAVVGIVLATRSGQEGPARSARLLRWAALILTVVTAALLTPYTVDDSGATAAFLLGVPVVGGAIPVLAERRGRYVAVATAAAAITMTVWAIMLAVGIGLYFLPAAILLVTAAVAQTGTRRSRTAA